MPSKHGQSRLMSGIEASSNTVVAFLLSWFLNAAVFPKILHVKIDTGQAFVMTFVFTLLSILRQYTLRRLFNALDRR